MKREGRLEPGMIVVAALMRDQDRRVLVQRRPEGGSMPGLWEFPGGKVESGESPERALSRELREELGIDVERETLRPLAFSTGDIAGRALVLLLYDCPVWHGDPRPLHASELAWVGATDLATLPMPPADGPLVAALLRAERLGE